jgi:hypothetical protein
MNTWLVALYGLDGTVRRKAVRLPRSTPARSSVSSRGRCGEEGSIGGEASSSGLAAEGRISRRRCGNHPSADRAGGKGSGHI